MPAGDGKANKKSEVYERVRKQERENLERDISRIILFEHPELKNTDKLQTQIQHFSDLVEIGQYDREKVHNRAEEIIQVEVAQYLAERAAMLKAKEEAERQAKAAEQEQNRRDMEALYGEAARAFALKEARWEELMQQQKCLFRDLPISWDAVSKTKITVSENAFGEADIEEEPDGKRHLINYDGTQYTREQFLRRVFPEYKKYPYKVKFKTDDVFRLGSNQRAKLQYHILAQRFPLVRVNEEDKSALELLCSQHKAETAQRWLNRMNWENGHEKIISFGVALEVRGTANKVWCYSAQMDKNTASYVGVSMTWEKWVQPITEYLDEWRKVMADLNAGIGEVSPEIKRGIVEVTLSKALSMLFYQNRHYLTLPGKEYQDLRGWIYDYFSSGAPCPY